MRRRFSTMLAASLLALSFQALAGITPKPTSSIAGISLPASADVDLNGAANYRVPISVPEGINGHTPKLAINYSSNAKEGLLGYGWTLSGLSSINRCPTTYYADGFIDGIDLDQLDKFCLNGMRLVHISDKYGQDGTEYRTLSDTYKKVVSHGNLSGSPEWFEVWDRDGNRYEYRSLLANSSGAPLRWALTTSTDKAGNHITYSYQQENANATQLIEQITYGNNEVKFEYDSRSRPLVTHIAGFRIDHNRKIRNIKIIQNHQVVSEITPAYMNRQGGDYLKHLEICRLSNSCIQEIITDWGDNQAKAVTAPNLLIQGFGRNYGRSPGNWLTERHPRMMADVDGDGRKDVVGFADNGVYVAFSNGRGFDSAKLLYPNGYGYHQGWRVEKHPRMMADVDGDGRQDIVGFADDGGYVAFSNGRGFNTANLLIGGYGYHHGWRVEKHPRMMADVDGDGRQDVVGFADDGVYVAFSEGRTFTPPQLLSGSFGRLGGWMNAYHPRMMADVDGDGRQDIVGFADNGVHVAFSNGRGFDAPLHMNGSFGRNYGRSPGSWLTERHPRMMADVDGDGRQDIVGFADDGVYVAFSNDRGFDAGSLLIGGYGYHHGWRVGVHPRMMADIDGDGRKDVVGFADNGVYVSFSKGRTFEAPQLITGHFGRHGGWMNAYHPRMMADVDGDGRQDIVGFADNGVQIAFASSPDNKVRTIQSSLGTKTEFAYSRLTDSGVYQKGNSAQYPARDVQTSQSVVKTLSQSDGIGGFNRYHYKYMGKRSHLLGAGNLGFASISRHDEARNLVRVRHSHQEVEDSLLYGALKQEIQCLVVVGQSVGFNTCSPTATNKIWQKDNVWQSVKYQGYSPSYNNGFSVSKTYLPQFKEGERYRQQLKKTTIRRWDLDGTALSTETFDRQYNQWYGHLTSENHTITDHINGISRTTSVTNQYKQPDEESWLVNLLEQQTVETTGNALFSVGNEQDFTNTTRYEYTPSGLLTAQIREPGTSLELVSRFTDHWQGLPQTVTEQWTASSSLGLDSQSRTTRYQYDANGYIQKTTDALGQAEQHQYDPVTGNLLNYTDVNGLVTSMRYDDWGRLIAEDNPDGSWRRIQYNSCIACESAVYQAEITSSSEAPVTVWYDALYREVRRGISIAGQPSLSIVATRYNSRGLVSRVTVPSFNPTSAPQTDYEYDALGRISSLTKPDRSITSYTYNGYSTEVTNALNQRTVTNHNAFGQKIEIIDDANSALSYFYDGRGNLTKTVDPADNEIRIDYDVLGRRISLDDPDKGLVRYRVNALGLPAQQTDARGKVIQVRYDLLGRMIERTTDAYGSQRTVANWHFSKNRLNTVQQPDYLESYQYNSKGQLSHKSFSLEGNSYQQALQYRSDGTVEQITYDDQVKVRYEYDNQGYLTDVLLAAQKTGVSGKVWQTPGKVWSLESMDAWGNITQSRLGNGLTSHKLYKEDSGLIESIATFGAMASTKQLQDTQYEFDSIGNLVERRDRINDKNIDEMFMYDNLNRLTTVNGPKGTVAVVYDDLGNITYKSDVGHYKYENGRPHAVSRIYGIKNTSYAYDNSGNMTSGDGRSQSYTVFDKPLRITKGSNTTEFRYGPGFQRFKRVDTGDLGTTTTWYTGSAEIVQRGGKTTFRYYLGNFAIYEQEQGKLSGSTKYLLKDHIGSVVAIADEIGQVSERFSFDAWGKRRHVEGGDLIAPFTSITGRLGFTGHEMLDPVGLIHMNGRVYDPTIGRFLTADPYIQDYLTGIQAFNRYSYVQNNPLKYTDPTGLKSDDGSATGDRSSATGNGNYGGPGSRPGSVQRAGAEGADIRRAMTRGGYAGKKRREYNDYLSARKAEVEMELQEGPPTRGQLGNIGQALETVSFLSGATYESWSDLVQAEEVIDLGATLTRKIVHHEYPLYNSDSLPNTVYTTSGVWKDTLIDDIAITAIGMSSGIPKLPDLTAGISMPAGFQYRKLHTYEVPVYEKYDTISVYSINSPNDIELIGTYSEKLNYTKFLNYEKQTLIRTEYQLRHVGHLGPSSASTFFWDNH